jgi:AraC-like DNA-binding protein
VAPAVAAAARASTPASGGRIIDVAFDCGYTSQSAFAAMFRGHFGVPPSALYRGG